MVVDDTNPFRRYLLGELDESEQEALERMLMASDEDFQELLISEDELVDDYWAGKLSASQEQEYRQRFLVTPERRRQHRFGVALRKHVAAAAAKEGARTGRVLRGPWPRIWSLPLAAALAVALVAAAAWWIQQLQRSPVRLEQTAERVEGPTVAFFLTRGGLRSLEPETEQTLGVPVGVALVDLQLEIPSDAGGDYDVALEDARNDEILAEGTLPARTIEGQRVVVARVPSELLAPGDYRVVLRAPSEDGELAVLETYEFRVAGQ